MRNEADVSIADWGQTCAETSYAGRWAGASCTNKPNWPERIVRNKPNFRQLRYLTIPIECLSRQTKPISAGGWLYKQIQLRGQIVRNKANLARLRQGLDKQKMQNEPNF